MQTKVTPIPIAIVGLGFGKWIVKGLQRPENQELFRIVAVCDLDETRAESIAKTIGVKIATFDELLADPSLPAIGLFTSPVGRAKLVSKAIQAGKHVMTTKPFERDAAAAKDVLEESLRLGRVVHLNSPSPILSPDMAQIRTWQDKHRLGQPVAGQFSTWVRYHEKPDGEWRDDPDLCPVAPIFRIGIYLINDSIEIFGKPDEVQVMSSRLFTGRPTPDHAQLSIRFKTGALVNILASFCVNDLDSYRNSLTLNFENGTIYRNVGPERNMSPGANLSLVAGLDGKPALIESASFDITSGDYQWGAFHHAIITGKLISSDFPEKVAHGLRVIEAMSESERSGRPVKVGIP